MTISEEAEVAKASAPSSDAPRLPDFIIGGAPKCGTTSLHFILNQHADIALPDAEIHYFDADDPVAHPDFMFRAQGELEWFDCRPTHQANRDWYASRFAPMADARFIGEDSTTYLQSASAPARIRAALPDARLIFMLRDPVARAYSQYWHLMMTARADCTFEEALWRFPNIVLGSTYTPYLRAYFDVLGRDRVKVVLFEDFLRDKQRTLDGVTDFIGAPRMTVSEEASWFNRSRYPSSLAAQLWVNRVGRRVVRQRYRNHTGGKTGWSQAVRAKAHYWWFRHVMPRLLTADRPPPMREKTRAYLAQHLAARNHGLSELLARPMSEVWPGFDG